MKGMNCMKKGFLLCLTLLLCGCGKVETTTCVFKNEIAETTTEFEYKKDKIVNQTTTSASKYTVNGISEEQLLKLAHEAAEKFKDEEGIEYSYLISDELFTEVLTIDYKEADVNKLFELGLIANEKGKLSIEETVRLSEENGYDCNYGEE